MTLLDEARQELAQRTRTQIEEATAYRWAARAVAAWERAREMGSSAPGIAWLMDSHHYAEEAVEHAALSDDTGAVLAAVRQWMRTQYEGR